MDSNLGGKLISDIAVLHQVCELMEETETIKALGEYWHDMIYNEMEYSDGRPIAPEYLQLRA